MENLQKCISQEEMETNQKFQEVEKIIKEAEQTVLVSWAEKVNNLKSKLNR